MADEATIETIKARARAVLDARAAAGGPVRPRSAAAGARQTRSVSSSSEPAFSPPPPASPRAITEMLAREDGDAGTSTSSERRGRSASPVARLDLVQPGASRGRSPSGSLNKSLTKVMNPSRTIAERWKRFDAEAERLEQQVAGLTGSAADVDGVVQGDDAVDAELEALKARERVLLEKAAPHRDSAEPSQASANDEASLSEDDIDAELEALRAQEQMLLDKVAPKPVERAGDLHAVDAHENSTVPNENEEKIETSTCCTSLRNKNPPTEMGAPVPTGGAHQTQPAGGDLASNLSIAEYYKWRAPTEHGIAWRVGNIVLAIVVGLVLLVLLVAEVAASIPVWILNLIVGVVMAYGTHFVVNTLYVSRLGIVREWLIRRSRRCCRSCRDHDEHSRPLRVDVELPLHNASAAAGSRFCTIHTIALFFDNYAYLIVDRSQGDTKPFPCALVDPADADGVMEELKRLAVEEYGAERGTPLEHTLQVEAILTTHKHWDHAWGNRRLTDGKTIVPPAPAHGSNTNGRPKLKVFGGKYDDVDCCTDALHEGETKCIVGSLQFEILHTPCHTAGSIMFLLPGVEGRDVLFTGDSLFVGGVGAHFEGSAEDSAHNMRKVWLKCAPNTLIFAGHEYTLPFLRDRFGSGQIPTDKIKLRRLTSALHRATILRERQLPTVPASLADEIGYNSAFDWLHSSATLLQETWRRFKLVELAREEADDLGDTRLNHAVPYEERRSALVPGPRWLRGGGGVLVPQSVEEVADRPTPRHGHTCVSSEDVDFDDEGWIARHAQHLWSLGALVEESPPAAAKVGVQLRQQSDQLRSNLSNCRSMVEAEEALAAQKGVAKQELLQGGGVRFVWGTAPAGRRKRERVENPQDEPSDGKCHRCFRCFCCCGCCSSSADTGKGGTGRGLTLDEGAQAISEAANDCISLLVVVPGAPGVTPGASDLRRAPADTGRSSLRSAVQRLDAACKAMQEIDSVVDQDRENAEDVLRAFVDIGGDAEEGTIAVKTLYRALTELGNERTTLQAEDVDEIVQLCEVHVDGSLPRGPDDVHPDTSEQLTRLNTCLLDCFPLPHVPPGRCMPAKHMSTRLGDLLSHPLNTLRCTAGVDFVELTSTLWHFASPLYVLEQGIALVEQLRLLDEQTPGQEQPR